MLLSALLSNASQMQSRSLLRIPQRLSQSEGHKEPIQRSKTGNSHTACFLKQPVLISVLQHAQDTSLRMNSWTFPRQQITFTKPCFHWGWKIMRPLFCLFSLLCVLTQSHMNLDLTYKTIKNEQTCMILGGMFHISQGGGCHLLCK